MSSINLNPKRFIDGELEEFIYHYTNHAGAHGILSEGRIWAVHSELMNDINETRSGYKLLNDYASSRRSATHEIDQDSDGADVAAIEIQSKPDKAKQHDNLFVTCSSYRPDELSCGVGTGMTLVTHCSFELRSC